jgi:DeoR/GlpR family transcriptional regulator of sugar metabolism
LADHTVLDTEANFHVVGLDAIDTLITDVGILASQSLELSRHNIKILVAGRMNASEAPDDCQ